MKMKSPPYGNDVSALNNADYFFGYSQGCYAGAFDCPGQTNIGYCSDDSIAEYFLKNEHGAFAFIANSRYGLATDTGETNGPSQFHNRMFFNEIFGKNNTNIGKANQKAKESLAGFVSAADGGMRWVYYNVNLLGDPETRIHINYSLTLMPDFTVSSISFNPKNPVEYDDIIITAAVENKGNINLNLINVNVSLFVDDVYESSALLNLTNITLREVNFNRTASAGEHNITIKVDPGNEIPEQKKSNNNFTFGLNVLLCDLNRDGIIKQDWNDLSAAYKCFLGIGNCNKINYMNRAAAGSRYRCFLGG